MKIISFDLNTTEYSSREAVIAIGKFETLHLGHQEILSEAHKLSKDNNMKLIFMVYPDKDGFKNEIKKQIFPFQTRMELLQQYNPDLVITFEPNIKNYSTSVEHFIKYLKELNVSTIICGKDFQIKKDSNTQTFLAESFTLKIIDDVKIGNQKVSSTLIKEMFNNSSEIKEIAKALGFNYFVAGVVVRGQGRGKQLGFPTANLRVHDNLLWPNDGIYLSAASVKGKRYYSVTSISNNPTFGNIDKTFETHIFNFNEDIYAEKIYVELIDYIREPIKFNSKNELIEQIRKDIKVCESKIANFDKIK